MSSDSITRSLKHTHGGRGGEERVLGRKREGGREGREKIHMPHVSVRAEKERSWTVMFSFLLPFYGFLFHVVSCQLGFGGIPFICYSLDSLSYNLCPRNCGPFYICMLLLATKTQSSVSNN
jgi:hypothetical protein